MKKVSVKESWYIFSIAMLAVILLGGLWLFFKNPFVSNLPVSSGLIPLGTPVNISVNDNGSNSQVLFFHGSLLPEFDVKQDANITLKPNQKPCAVRAKVFMFNEQNKQLDLCVTAANIWQLLPDGYYYCEENLQPNLTIDFLEKIQIPDTTKNLHSANLYSIVVTVETLPTDVNYQNIWKIN